MSNNSNDKPADNSSQISPEAKEAIEAKLRDELVLKALMNLRMPSQPSKSEAANHKFWNTQPVPKLDQKFTKEENGPINVRTLDDVPKQSYALPTNYVWDSIDINDSKQLDEVYNLLSENYVEDDDNMFRFDYSREFLKWALTPPGYLKEWHCAVRKTTNGKLVGFISGTPAQIYVHGREVSMVEINYLCVHKDLRSKRLAPVLIKEITRRVEITDVWQAVYTAGVVIPKPVGQNRYYHRSLNPKKLIDIGFSRLAPKMTMAQTIKLYKVPTEPQSTTNIIKLTNEYIESAHKLLNTYLSKFPLHPIFTLDEFKHWFLPRQDVIDTYIVIDKSNNNKVTDMISFYHLPSSIIGNDKYNLLKAAYSFYNVATSMSWVDLMRDALIFAKQLDIDVFNALNVMENDTFLKELKFGIGDGHLQYYLYNWKCPELASNEVGLVLL